MYCIACSPVLQLFDRTAEILDDWAIDGFEFAARSHNRDESRYPVNGCPELRLALAQRPFSSFAFGQVDNEGVAFKAALTEGGQAHQHRYAASVFAQIFLFEWLNDPSRLHFLDSQCIALAPVGQR